MQIEKHANNELTAEISIQISPEDYVAKFQKGLKEYAKKVRMPGFRPGMVPVGMVKKMVGKSLLADELNNITSEAIFNYIRDNKIEIIGNPLPVLSEQGELEIDNLKDYTFKFEIAYAPDFDVDISANVKVDFHRFKPDDAYINERVEEFRKRLGQPQEVEVSEKDDEIYGAIAELDENGEVKEGGFSNENVHLTFLDIKNESHQAQFIGLKSGSSVEFVPSELVENETARKKIFGDVNGSAKVRFTVLKIERIQPAEINQEFFDQLFGEGVVNSEQEMRDKIANDAIQTYEKNAENRFFNQAVEHILNTTNFTLPEDFLKRWLISVNREQVNADDIIQNFDKYERGIRWQLIEAKIIRNHNITVTEDEVINLFYQDYMNYFGGMGINEDLSERIMEMAKGMLKNEAETNKAYDRLYIEKMTSLFKENLSLNVIENTFEKWLEEMNKPIGNQA